MIDPASRDVCSRVAMDGSIGEAQRVDRHMVCQANPRKLNGECDVMHHVPVLQNSQQPPVSPAFSYFHGHTKNHF